MTKQGKEDLQTLKEAGKLTGRYVEKGVLVTLRGAVKLGSFLSRIRINTNQGEN